jgi:hypothetical protein
MSVGILAVLQDIVSDRPGINAHTLAQIILLAVEIAREGHKVGTLFVVIDLIELKT